MRNVLREWFWTAKVLRLERLEKEVGKLERSHKALKRVWSVSKQQFTPQHKSNCEACVKTLSISRRCMSPGAAGAPTEDIEFRNYAHAIVVGEDSVKFCLRCHGQLSIEGSEPGHSPRMCGFKAALSAP